LKKKIKKKKFLKKKIEKFKKSSKIDIAASTMISETRRLRIFYCRRPKAPKRAILSKIK